MHIICNLLIILLFLPVNIFAADNDISEKPAAIKAKTIEYDSNSDLVYANGDVFITIENYTLQAEHVYYDLKKDLVYAEGNVRIKDDEGKVILGKKAVFKDKMKIGIISGFVLKLDQDSVIAAGLAEKLDQNRVNLYKTRFTPCQISCNRKPIWQMSSGKTHIDNENHRITHNHLFFEVYGVPVAYFPYFSHPTPSAPAQSGILIPYLKNDDVAIPVYYRAKPNLDLTISPRIGKKHTIFEGELRHKLKNGDYKITGSFANLPYKTVDKGVTAKNTKLKRYHIVAQGSFYKNDINYGFNINRASDKAYLKNYHNIQASHLESRLFLNKINRRNYFSLEAIHFQGLSAEDEKNNPATILPSIRSQNIFGLNDDETLLLNVRNNTVFYHKPHGTQLTRSSLELALVSNLMFDNGQLVTLEASNRGDLYLTKFVEENRKKKKLQKTWYRNIPELKAKWRYPLINSISRKTILKFEPTIMAAIGRNYEERFAKFGLIDASKSELSENNIFSSNRFSGIDYHEYGRRLSYGVNSSLLSDPLYIDLFLGQMVHKNNFSGRNNLEYVGSSTFDINGNFELFYRFRKSKDLKPIRDEIGIQVQTKKLTARSTFAKLNNIPRYYAREDATNSIDKISQVSFDLGYQIIPNLWLGSDMHLDITSKKNRILTRSIRMTYLKDCVSITVKLHDDYTNDGSRGVRKNNSKTIVVRLKALNM